MKYLFGGLAVVYIAMFIAYIIGAYDPSAEFVGSLLFNLAVMCALVSAYESRSNW